MISTIRTALRTVAAPMRGGGRHGGTWRASEVLAQVWFFKLGDRDLDVLLFLSIQLHMSRVYSVFYNEQVLVTTLIACNLTGYRPMVEQKKCN